MSYNKQQFEKVIRDTLAWAEKNSGLKLLSDSAVNLLLGTAAQESKFGTYLYQIEGPALGAFQIEPTTFKSVQKLYRDKFNWFDQCSADELKTDLCLSIIVARLLYHSIKHPLPAADDITGMAVYYKLYFNTNAGKATTEQFIENYQRYVKGA